MSGPVKALLERLAFAIPEQAEPRAVGGFLRDALAGRESRDIDLTVRGDAPALARRLAGTLGGTFVPLDEERGIARIVLQDGGSHVHLDIASLQGDPQADLSRRDFTVDAMSLPLDELLRPGWRLHLLDPFGGMDDLDRGVVRAVRPDVFQEDGLRLIRAVRLAASLGFAIEPATAEMIRARAPLIRTVSGERVRDEFLAILSNREAGRLVYLLDDLRLLTAVVPELEDGRGVTQPKEHYWDVLTHNIETVGTVQRLLAREYDPAWVVDQVPWDHELEAHFAESGGDGVTRATLLKLAGLLHDVAKPRTKSLEADGRMRFFGHHTEGAAMVREVLNRLRASRRVVTSVHTMVEHHLRPGQMSQGEALATPRAVYRFFRRAGDVAVDTLYLNLADYLSARGPLLEREEWALYARKVRHILETARHQEERPAPARMVDGHELMASLGLSPGPVIGRLLETVREAQATGEVATKEEALELARALLYGGREGQHA